jgi:hypothetical protein
MSFSEKNKKNFRKQKRNKFWFESPSIFLLGDIVSGFGTRPGVTQALWPRNSQLSDFPVGASTTVQIGTEPDLTFGNISQVFKCRIFVRLQTIWGKFKSLYIFNGDREL